jgi:hypothetical protein
MTPSGTYRYGVGDLGLGIKFRLDILNAGVELFSSGPTRVGEDVTTSFGTSIKGLRSTHAYLSYELRLEPR